MSLALLRSAWRESPYAVKKFRQADTETVRKANKDSDTGIPLAALDPADIGEGEAAGIGYLLLGEAAFGADSEDVSAETVEGIAGHGGIVVAWGRSALELISLEVG